MRNTRTLSVTLPPDMLKRAQSIAKKESRTMIPVIGVDKFLAFLP